jgi:hypothetical protein
MWIAVGVWEHEFWIGCEEETNEGNGPRLRKSFLGNGGGESFREERGLGGDGLRGEGDQ